MSANDLFPDFFDEQYDLRRKKRKAPAELNAKPLSRKQAIKITLIENVHASNAHRQDMVRAHALYHRAQGKLIKNKITKIFFN